MTKIETVLEFKNIMQGNFGFIVVTNDKSNTVHQSNCDELNDEFTEVGNAFHWFATLSLAEKSFKTTPCGKCNPESR